MKLSLKELNEKLIKELNETKEHLKKYTAPSYKKNYYETNKDEIKQKTSRILKEAAQDMHIVRLQIQKIESKAA